MLGPPLTHLHDLSILRRGVKVITDEDGVCPYGVVHCRHQKGGAARAASATAPKSGLAASKRWELPCTNRPRNLLTFHIAGFPPTTGRLCPSKIKAGDVLALVPEPDNPYDPDAVAVKYGDVMLGYVPADSVGPLSVMFHYGHGDAFECRVLQVAPERSPWHQVRAAVFVRDAR